MNTIIIKEDNIIKRDIDSSIKVTFESKNNFFELNKIIIDFYKNTNLKIRFDESLNPTKLDLTFNIHENVNVLIDDYKINNDYKIKYKYNISRNAQVNLNKFYDVNEIKEYVVINLDGEDALVDYNFKTISTGSEKYDLTIYHNSKKTSSNIKNNGVNICEGNLIFNVSSFVYKKNILCNVNQSSRIVNLVNEKCSINPNLFIDEYDVIANHSAHIGKFSDEEMFYINSRGIDNKNANKLLINGFLTSNVDEFLNEKINNSIEKYWR